MPGFLSRAVEWFKTRPRTQQVLIGAVVLVVLAVASPAVAALAGLVFAVALIVLVVQLVHRRPVRPWAIAAGGGLVVALVFGGLSSALNAPESDQQKVERAQKPKAEEPKAAEEQDPPEEKPAKESKEKPQEQDLHGQAVVEPLAPYKVDYTSGETDQRLDVFVVTERTTNKPRLGRILIDLQQSSEPAPDLVAAFFCTKPGEQGCADTTFATGEYAATAQGKSFMTGEQVLSKAGEWPFIKVEF